MTALDTEARLAEIGAEGRVPTIEELVVTLERHFTVRIPPLNDRLHLAAMSAIRDGRTTICEYPKTERTTAFHRPKLVVGVEPPLHLVAAE